MLAERLKSPKIRRSPMSAPPPKADMRLRFTKASQWSKTGGNLAPFDEKFYKLSACFFTHFSNRSEFAIRISPYPVSIRFNSDS